MNRDKSVKGFYELNKINQGWHCASPDLFIFFSSIYVVLAGFIILINSMIS